MTVIQELIPEVKVKTCRKCGAFFNGVRCKKCQSEYKSKNIEKIKIYNKQWNIENSEIQRIKKAEWNENNAAKAKKFKAAWHLANKEKSRIDKSIWAKNNKEKMVEYIKDWHIANPNASKIYRHTRRARKENNGGVLSKNIYEKLFKLQKGKCVCCGSSLGDNCHMDHIMPLALGGKNDDSNMQLLTSRCNLQKRAKHPIDFMRSRGFLI